MDELSTYLALPYTAVYVVDHTTEGARVYLASNPELPGCMAHGDTPEEALENLADARELYIRTALARGLSVPRPSMSFITGQVALETSAAHVPTPAVDRSPVEATGTQDQEEAWRTEPQLLIPA